MTLKLESSTTDAYDQEQIPPGSTALDEGVNPLSFRNVDWFLSNLIEPDAEDECSHQVTTDQQRYAILSQSDSRTAFRVIYCNHFGVPYRFPIGDAEMVYGTSANDPLLRLAVERGVLVDTSIRQLRDVPTESQFRTTSDMGILFDLVASRDPHLLGVHGKVVTQIENAFVAANEEVFEGGFDSNFSLAITALVHTHGMVAIEALNKAISIERNFEVKAEAIQQIGSIEDARTHNLRLAILLNQLESDDARIRDAASIGVADMDDPSAIQAVLEALEKETSTSLRRNLGLVLGQLEETGAASAER